MSRSWARFASTIKSSYVNTAERHACSFQTTRLVLLADTGGVVVPWGTAPRRITNTHASISPLTEPTFPTSREFKHTQQLHPRLHLEQCPLRLYCPCLQEFDRPGLYCTLRASTPEAACPFRFIPDTVPGSSACSTRAGVPRLLQ